MAGTSDARVDVVVVAAGASTRMAGVDKVTATIAGRPLLAWTLDAVATTPGLVDVVVVAAPSRVGQLGEAAWLRAFGARVVAGGARRQESVAAGVAATGSETVLVHDGARPLGSPGLFKRVAEAARRDGAAIPVITVRDTLKRVVDGSIRGTVPREGVAAAQTPQGVRRGLLDEAWRRFPAAGEREFTDEAALLEAAGIAVTAVEGEARNLKVTEPDDLAHVEVLLAGRAARQRVGSGRDSHPFGPFDGLRLGGIEIPDAPRLHGHSDGDAALHAVADALLGAVAMGDLGRVFPAGDPATAGIDSSRLLVDVVRRVRDAGFRAASLDVTIVAARPRLGAARLDAMRDRIASLVGLDRAAVSVKASTGNLDAAEGAGRSIAAHALATVVPA